MFLSFYCFVYLQDKNKESLKQYFLIFVIFFVILSFNFAIGIGLDNLSTSSAVKSFWNELEYEEQLSSCELQKLDCTSFYIKQKIEFVPLYMSNVNKLLFSVVNYTSAYNSFGEIPGYVPERRSYLIHNDFFTICF